MFQKCMDVVSEIEKLFRALDKLAEPVSSLLFEKQAQYAVKDVEGNLAKVCALFARQALNIFCVQGVGGQARLESDETSGGVRLRFTSSVGMSVVNHLILKVTSTVAQMYHLAKIVFSRSMY